MKKFPIFYKRTIQLYKPPLTESIRLENCYTNRMSYCNLNLVGAWVVPKQVIILEKTAFTATQ